MEEHQDVLLYSQEYLDEKGEYVFELNYQPVELNQPAKVIYRFFEDQDNTILEVDFVDVMKYKFYYNEPNLYADLFGECLKPSWLGFLATSFEKYRGSLKPQ